MKYSSFLIAFFATIVQYYDYALFGLSASILAKNFMPESSASQQLLHFFAVFGAAVIVKPIGSMIFGLIADNYGRSVSLKLSALLACISTSIVGLIPGYADIGLSAVIILALCRILFIMSLAGEIDGVRIYVAEKIGKNSENLGNGIVTCSSQVGALLAAFAYHLFVNYKQDIAELWRVNFLVGGALGLIVILLRHYFQEGADFLALRAERSAKHDVRILQPILSNWRYFLLSCFISGSIGGIYHFLVIFLPTFLVSNSNFIDSFEAQTISIQTISSYAICAVIAGYTADRLNPDKLINLALLLSLLMSIKLAMLDNMFPILLPVFIAALSPFYSVPLQMKVKSLFELRSRVRMFSLSHSVGGMLLSSPTPFICMLIWDRTYSYAAVFSYLIFLLLVIALSIFYLNNSAQRIEVPN